MRLLLVLSFIVAVGGDRLAKMAAICHRPGVSGTWVVSALLANTLIYTHMGYTEQEYSALGITERKAA